MKTKKIIKSEGFTIVETMIVLAIAGLILLIVLLAVPALQRQSNNTNIKSDAEALSSAINDFESNNGGFVPTMANFSAIKNGSEEAIGSPTGTTNGDIQSVAKIQSSVTIAKDPNAGQVPATSTGKVTIYLDIGYSCSGQSNSNQIAIYYPTEVSSGAENYSANNCIDA